MLTSYLTIDVNILEDLSLIIDFLEIELQSFLFFGMEEKL